MVREFEAAYSMMILVNGQYGSVRSLGSTYLRSFSAVDFVE